MGRMRLVGWEVKPIVMADDGDYLTPVPVGAQTIPAAGWDAFKAGGDAAALEQLRAQIEGPPLAEEQPPNEEAGGDAHDGPQPGDDGGGSHVDREYQPSA